MVAVRPLVSHVRGQVEREYRERDQNDQPDEIGDDERQHAEKYRREAHVLHHALDDEYVHADRRMDEPELHRHHDDDPEPDRVEAELHDHREDDRDGQDDHGQRVHQAAEDEIHQHDQRQHPVAAEAEPGEKGGHLLRRLRHGEEIAEDAARRSAR